ncbi:acyl-CoA carboxylase subunit epsilon [Nocardia sp. CC227C]|uniref:acyl-CoA carboxylase subunit epsilon n=1 Tax=Nocardia sp. CC227C TaxID=3044562 RepID=UPI00278BCBF3|nr:acyl-CoA carboxylase subunit epsilon [Nocardia sp. CC227C]
MADEEVLRAAELDLAVDEFVEVVDAPVIDAEPAHAGPVVQVLKGNPTDDELAALVAVLTAAAANAAAAPVATGPTDMWGRPTLLHRGTSPFSPYAFPALSHLRG